MAGARSPRRTSTPPPKQTPQSATERLSMLTAELSGRIQDLNRAWEALMKAKRLEEHLRAEVDELGIAATLAARDLPRSDVSALFHTIALQAQALTDADYVALGIGNDPTKSFDPWVVIGVPASLTTSIGRIPRPVGTLGAVAEHDAIIRTKDVRTHPAFVGLPTTHPEIGPLLGMPIHDRGHAVGNLYLAKRPGAAPFTERDERVIQLLASKVGAAVATTRLYSNERGERLWLQNVIEQMPNGVLLYDEHGELKTMNQASASLLGGAPLDLREDATHPLCNGKDPIARALHGDETVRKEALLFRKDMAPTPVSVSAIAIRDAAMRVTGVTMILDDVSCQKLAERMREEWTAVVAHDLRQPVSVISLAAEMLLQRSAGQLSELDRRGLERIRVASRNLTRMISDLTQASLIESKQLSVEARLVDIGHLVDIVVEGFAADASGFHLHTSFEGEVYARVDPERIQQVLVNLIANAIKYGDPNTEIVVEIKPTDELVEIVVTNHGPGIPPEQMPCLFSRFVRTKEARAGKVQGLGLGLYIAKGIVEAHGGRIWAESVPGDVTAFHFTLRRGQPTRASTGGTAAAHEH